jgi:hypothetical protein
MGVFAGGASAHGGVSKRAVTFQVKPVQTHGH